MLNEVKLQESHPVDSNLRPLKVGGKSTSLELAQTDGGARISGGLEVTGSGKPIVANPLITNAIVHDSDFRMTSIASDSMLFDHQGFVRMNEIATDHYTVEFKPTGSAGAGAYMKLTSILDVGDYSILETTTDGVTSLTTVDDDGADAHLTLDVDGDIILDPASGNFKSKNNGTEFSATNSAYAGMILGYTRIQNDSATVGNNSISITTTMTVLETVAGTECKVTFIAPPSERVEIQFCCQQLYGRIAYYSLSSAASYAEVDETHTYDSSGVVHDETDAGITNIAFSITSGLTAGTSYTRWIAAKSNTSTVTIMHGRNRATGTHNPPIIIRAIALPADGQSPDHFLTGE